MNGAFTDTRGVSIAVTHVLTLAITTVVISGLLIGAGSMLDTERERGADVSLEIVGERVASQLASVDRMATSTNTTSVSIEVTHPAFVSGSRYHITIPPNCESPVIGQNVSCLRLTGIDEDIEVEVPFSVSTDVDGGDGISGGSFYIVYDHDAEVIRLQEEPP